MRPTPPRRVSSRPTPRRNDPSSIQQADFNHDGHADIALIAGVGNGGALATYRIHLWDESARQFRKFGPIVGNPTLQPARKALVAWERDGPAWNSTEYRSDNGFGWLFVRYQGRGKPIEPWIDAEAIVP